MSDAYADRVVDILEGYAPGLEALVRARTAVTPDDLQPSNSNLVGGDSAAGSHDLRAVLDVCVRA